MRIDDNNYESCLFRYCEGMLDERERADVEAALALHPEWQELVDQYKAAPRLSSAAPVAYPNAASLRDGGPRSVRRKRLIPIWISSAVAACLLLAVGAAFWLRGSSETGTPMASLIKNHRPPVVAPDTLAPAEEPAALPTVSPSVRPSSPAVRRPQTVRAVQPVGNQLVENGEAEETAAPETVPEHLVLLPSDLVADQSTSPTDVVPASENAVQEPRKIGIINYLDNYESVSDTSSVLILQMATETVQQSAWQRVGSVAVVATRTYVRSRTLIRAQRQSLDEADELTLIPNPIINNLIAFML